MQRTLYPIQTFPDSSFISLQNFSFTPPKNQVLTEIKMLPFKVSKKHHKHINNPFPPRSTTFIPSIHGSLSFNPHHLPSHHLFPIGDHFHLAWSSTHGGSLSIAHNSHPNLSLWSTVPGQPFISAAVVETQVDESRGSFSINDGEVFFASNHQFIDEIRILEQCGIAGNNDKAHDFIDFEVLNFPVLVVTGFVCCKRATKSSYVARYWFVLDQKNRNQVGFSVKFGDLVQQWRAGTFRKVSWRLDRWKRKLVRFRGRRFDLFSTRKRSFRAIASEDDDEEEFEVGLFRELNRIFITYSSERDERFYGFGEQFSCVEFKGKRVPILVQEQGIGRGDQPITFAANLVSYRSGGDWSTTYAPSPFYMTSKMRSLYLEGYDYSVFDLRKHDRVQIEIYGNSAQGRILHGTSPAELIENFTETIGRPPELPDWIVSGAIVGMQGGTEAVRRVWSELQDHDVPISAFWLQDWVGQRETIIGSQLWWNWEVDNDHYSGWRRLVDDLRSCNVRVMTYCNPCLVPTDEKMNTKRDLFEEAKRLGILVKNDNGEIYMIPNTTFDVGMLDFTHPETNGWFKKILREMVDSGVRGWMADFGEGLPLDANIFSGEDPIAAHNQYPELWARANREFTDEWKSSSDEKEENLVFFMRAGFRGSSKWTMLLWEGDQMVSWQKNDGIKSSVTGLLSSGLSGFPLNHSDIGGYCAVNLPIIRYRRSEELLMRWMELNAFSTVFRTHEGNNPSINCQFYSNRSTLDHFARFAKVYKAWKFYRIKLVKEASERGLPVVRHLFIHYPDDEHVRNLSYQQFLVGTEFLVVPVLDKGKKDVGVYFPVAEGLSWQHIWSGRVFSKAWSDLGHKKQGFETRVDAPIGYPAVFVKYGSPVGQTFLNNLRDLNVI